VIAGRLGHERGGELSLRVRVVGQRIDADMSMRCVMAAVLGGMVGLCQPVFAQIPGGIPTVTTITPGSLYHSHPSTYSSGNGVTYSQPNGHVNRGSAPLPKGNANGTIQTNPGATTTPQTTSTTDQPAGNPLPLSAPLQQPLSAIGVRAGPQATLPGMPGTPGQPAAGATALPSGVAQPLPVVPFSITPIALQAQQTPGKTGSQYVPLASSPLISPLNKPLSTPVQQSLTLPTPPSGKPSSAGGAQTQTSSSSAPAPQTAAPAAAKP
jgi:hypothetical protein